MTVWIFEHTIDYEGVLTLEIFSTAEKACSFAVDYVSRNYPEWPTKWRASHKEEHLLWVAKRVRDHTINIWPYEVDKCV